MFNACTVIFAFNCTLGNRSLNKFMFVSISSILEPPLIYSLIPGGPSILNPRFICL